MRETREDLPAPASLSRRAVLLLGWTAGFYALALGTAAGLVAIAVLSVQTFGERGGPLALLSALAAGILLRGTVLLPDRFEPPGPRVHPHEHPRLFALIEEVADALGVPAPDEVYLSVDVNALMGEVGPLGKKRRVLVLGVGLISVENVGQLKAAIAHELSHLEAGDTKLTAYIAKNRERLERWVNAFEGSALAWPFLAYAKVYLRASSLISRAQELNADRRAVEVAGKAAHIGGLLAVERALFAFQRFQHEVLYAVVAEGFWPVNLFEGLRRFLAHAQGGHTDLFGVELPKESAYDTHPSTERRIRHAEALPDPGIACDERPARSLLEEPELVEREVTSFAGERLLRGAPSHPLDWDEFAEAVIRPRLLRLADEARAEVASLFGAERAETYADALFALLGMLARSQPAGQPSEPGQAGLAEVASALRARVEGQIAILLGATLVLRGGEVHADVGGPIEITVEGHRYDIRQLAHDAAHDPARARALLEELTRAP